MRMGRWRRRPEKELAGVKTLRDIETEVAALARHLGAAGQDLPTYGISHDFGRPHVEVENALYHYVVMERGEELERRSTKSYDELLYWIFSDVTHKLAFSYEMMDRVEDQDCRRIAFPKQIEFMKQISSTMGCDSREISPTFSAAHPTTMGRPRLLIVCGAAVPSNNSYRGWCRVRRSSLLRIWQTGWSQRVGAKVPPDGAIRESARGWPRISQALHPGYADTDSNFKQRNTIRETSSASSGKRPRFCS
jgi:Immunity protein 63